MYFQRVAIAQSLSFCTTKQFYCVPCAWPETVSLPPNSHPKAEPRTRIRVQAFSTPRGEKSDSKGRAASAGCVTKRPPASGQLELSPPGGCWETAAHSSVLLLCQLLVCCWLRAGKVALALWHSVWPALRAGSTVPREEAGKGHGDKQHLLEIMFQSVCLGKPPGLWNSKAAREIITQLRVYITWTSQNANSSCGCVLGSLELSPLLFSSQGLGLPQTVSHAVLVTLLVLRYSWRR